MATLLQPQNNKNCMKNNGATSSNATTATTAATGQRILLPHEIVQFGNSNNMMSSSTAVNAAAQSHLIMNNLNHNGAYSSSSSSSSFNATNYHQLENNHHQQLQHNQTNNSSHISQQQQQQLFNTTITPRYFSQFSNNIQHNTTLSLINNKLLPHEQIPPTTIATTTTLNQQQLQLHNSIISATSYTNIKKEPNDRQYEHLNNGDCKDNSDNKNSIKNENDEEGVDDKGAKNLNKIKNDEAAQDPSSAEQEEPDPEIDIVINNVVCSFSVRCHLNLRDIALKGFNVEFRRENGMVTMKLRRPYTTASIWSSGKITCTGATSENMARIAARRYARCLQKLGFNCRFRNYRVVNVLGTCSMPWAIKIVNFSKKYKKEASYEPELHPGVTYKLKYPKATLKIFSTGSITVTAASVDHVQAAIEHIYKLVYEFRKKRTAQDLELLRIKQENALSIRQIGQKSEQNHQHSSKRLKRKRRRLNSDIEGNTDEDCAEEVEEDEDEGEDDFQKKSIKDEVYEEVDNFDDIIEECPTDDE